MKYVGEITDKVKNIFYSSNPSTSE